MSQIQAALTKFILNPANHDVLSIVKGARNGIVYGAKIRFPHALVMVFLFGSGSPREKFRKILTATRQHAVRLGSYVAIYKTVLAILRDLSPSGKQDPNHSFIAGLIGGWFVRHQLTQIVLYCVGRCIASLLPRAKVPSDYPANKVIPIDNKAHQIFAAITWGTVMWLFVNRRQRLNGGLVNSMDYLYVLSDKWDGLRNFLWHNV